MPAILANGVEWYQNISTSKDAGTKLMGFSGRVKNPGVWELPFGTTAREILEDYAGGMRDGLKFKALATGRSRDRLPHRSAPRSADGIRKHW
ncbi:NADH-ubiquinone oxidoreductase subunit F [Klebsiella pneumoniae]|uniref:NADH-quinone oxidoreductase subunit F n=1 Tax=Klebsiella pneumoniae TaxID=573 RepID=A0A377XQ25_KLEPN|nr:NADH-ubiquinone oxidoreductase subunit F [Klebsiella pneumoniae]